MTLTSHDRRWAMLWRSKNCLDGYHEHFIRGDDGNVAIFKSRSEARRFIKGKYGYLRNRPDLRTEPYGWMMPMPVPVMVRVRRCAEAA